MTLRVSDLQSDSELDSICNSCDVYFISVETSLLNPIIKYDVEILTFLLHRVLYLNNQYKEYFCSSFIILQTEGIIWYTVSTV